MTMTMPETTSQPLSSTEARKNWHLPSIVPVFEKDKLTAYDIGSPSGDQKFRVTPKDPRFLSLTEQLLENMENSAEDTQPLEVARKVKRTMLEMGMPTDQLPKSPEEALTRLKSMMTTYAEMQQVAAQVGLLQMYSESLTMNPIEWYKLNPQARASLSAVHSALTIVLAQKIGVNDETVSTSKRIVEIQANATAASRLSIFVQGALGALKNGSLDLISDTLSALGEGLGGIVYETKGALKGQPSSRRKRIADEKKTKTPPLTPFARPTPLSLGTGTEETQPFRPASSLPLRPASSLGRPAPRPMGSSSKPTYHQIGNQNQ